MELGILTAGKEEQETRELWRTSKANVIFEEIWTNALNTTHQSPSHTNLHPKGQISQRQFALAVAADLASASGKSERKLLSTPPTLLEMYHPAFIEGYQNGQRHAFWEPHVLTDKLVVEMLLDLFRESRLDENDEREDGLYYSIGYILGQISARVFPPLPHEDNRRDLQEALLLKITHQYGATEQALIQTIRHFWDTQDELAQRLDADIFEEVLHHGAEQG